MEGHGNEVALGKLVEQLVEALGEPVRSREIVSATWRRHSNDVGRIELDDGRVLMVKVARFEWAAEGFRAERRAARLLARNGVVAPRHLDCPERVDGRAVLCYWRIQLPTLATAWPDLGPARRREVLRDWGALLRRVHEVPVGRCGPLGDGGACHDAVTDFMARDVGERLRPAVAGEWPEALGALDAALEALPQLEQAVGGAPSVLLHGDPHAKNLMCRVDEDVARCEGLIDLESAAGGPRELDLAHALVLHGPLFAQPLPHGWFEDLRAGYAVALDPYALRWFALYHLLNLGFFSAHVGDTEHAAAVARAAHASARNLGGGSGGTHHA